MKIQTNNASILRLFLTGSLAAISLNTFAGTVTEYNSVPGVQTDTSSSSKPQFIFINKKDAATTGINFKCTATPVNGTVTGYNWIFPGGSPGNSTAQNPGTVQFAGLKEGDVKACTLGVTHQGSKGESCAVSSNPISKISVEVPNILPDGSQVGATIPSTITDGTQQLHFVSPQATSSDYVTVVASVPGVTSSNFGILLEWDTSVGTDVSGSPNKWRVSRGTAGKFTINLKRVNDHTIVASINVWIIWATITSSPIPITAVDNGTDLQIGGGYTFTHTISPSSIFTDADIPNLEGAKDTNPPGGNNSCGSALSGGADEKWDNSRQIREKYIIPAGYPTNCLDAISSTYPATTPPLNVVGNDDASTGDETNDPYSNTAVLNGEDTPTRDWAHSYGANGDAIEHRLNFQEFTRVDLAGTWYMISNFYPWQVDIKYLKVSSKWTNNGSSEATNNSGF